MAESMSAKIFTDLSDKKRLLTRHERPTVTTEIHSIKPVAMRIELLSHLLLKKIVVETVDIQNTLARLFGSTTGVVSYDCAPYAAGIIIRLRHIAFFESAAKRIRKPVGSRQ